MRGSVQSTNNALIALAKAAAQRITQESFPVRYLERLKWQLSREDGNYRRENTREYLPPGPIIFEDWYVDDELLTTAIQDDPDFGPVLGKMVGTSQSRTRFDLASV